MPSTAIHGLRTCPLGSCAHSLPSHDDVAKEKFLKGTVFEDAGLAYGLDPLLLYAIALAESGRSAGHGLVAPWPWALRVPGRGIYADTRARACARLHDMTRLHHDALDVGLIQVSLEWHRFRVARPTDLLDPATNVTVAAAILAEALESSPGDRELGIGRYHSWVCKPCARRYGAYVLGIVRNLKTFEGGWSP